MLHVKNDFPFFKNNPDLMYMDSAATTQKPQVVIDSLTEFYTTNNANAGRSSYPLANKLTKKIEAVREQVQRFINAKEAHEIIFTSGSTDAFNKVAYSMAINYLKDGDEILYCTHDHQSFVLPWFAVQSLLQRMNITIKLIPFTVTKMGSIDRADLLSKVTSKTKVVNVTHVHNIYGTDSDIHALRDKIENDVIINVDATQSVGHMKVDVQHMKADILSFSGHKMFASQGTGATFIRKKIHPFIKPIFSGGGNGCKLENDLVTITDFSHAYESGTQHYAGIVSLGRAIEYVEELGIDAIHTHLAELTQYLLTELKKLPHIEFAYGPYYWTCADGIGIISFKVKGLSSNEVGFMLSENNILVRTGDHCMSKHDEFNDTVRVSMHVYNTMEDIDGLITVLKKIRNT